MYYSVTFYYPGIAQKNTWADWHLIPETPPMIPPPEQVTNLVEIPGRPNPLDLSRVPFNRRFYKRITGSWNFLREPDNRRTRFELYDEMVILFTAKEGFCQLEEDPGHYFRGRFAVGMPSTGTGPIRFSISYDLEPARLTSIYGAPPPSDPTFAPP